MSPLTPSKSKEDLQRFSTGVKGLDQLIDGGYPKERSVLLMGGPGVGKTIMALQFTVDACRAGAKCIYLATEETSEELLTQADQLGLGIDEHVKSGKLTIQPALAERMMDVQWHKGKPRSTSIFKNPINAISKTDADVVIIDNIGSYAFDVTIGNFREQMDYLIHNIREKGMSALIVCDETLDDRYNSVALYSVHGAIHLFKRENPFTGNVERLMNIVKMRGTKTPLGYLRYKITGQGITLESMKEQV
jgi:KaiC/GvpD/RAD55 family RecA-like ATPase